MKKHFALAAALAFAMPSGATIVFSDNFDAEGATALNYAGFAKWDVTDGTVDLIGTPNGFGITCAGGAGSCVDLDGSSGDAGIMTTKDSWTVGTQDLVTIGFSISGNQRIGAGSPSDTMEIGLLYDDSFAYALILTLPEDYPMTTFSFWQLLPSHAGTFRLYMKGFPEVRSDNIGLVVDDVSLDIAYAVPEPATWTMMIGGFALAGAALRRRKPAVSFA